MANQRQVSRKPVNKRDVTTLLSGNNLRIYKHANDGKLTEVKQAG